jgi:hypothetical protein
MLVLLLARDFGTGNPSSGERLEALMLLPVSVVGPNDAWEEVVVGTTISFTWSDKVWARSSRTCIDREVAETMVFSFCQ